MRKDVYSILLTKKGKFKNEMYSMIPFVCVCLSCQIANKEDLSAQRLSGKNFHCAFHTFLYCLYLLPHAYVSILIFKN